MLRNPVLIFVYYSLYFIVKTFLKIYYRKIHVVGLPARLPKGPYILLSNHPNALIDPLLVVSRFIRPIYFLANASMFKHPFANWFLNTFFCIPVERPKDVNRPIDNSESFRRSREHLEGQGILFIAPEGTSHREYRLRPLKTGAARIALDLLGAGHQSHINFLCVGITYADPASFRSRVRMQFAPIYTLHRTDLTGDITDWDHVAKLTLDLKHRMESLLLHTPTTEQDEALLQAATLFRPGLKANSWYALMQKLHQLMLEKGRQSQEWVSRLQHLLSQKKLSAFNPSWRKGGFPLVQTILFAPLAAWVFLHHIIVYALPEWLRRTLKADPVYDATIRYMGAWISVPIGTLWWLIPLFMLKGLTLATGIYTLAILALGPWAWQQYQRWKDLRIFLEYRRARKDEVWREELDKHLEPLMLSKV